MTWSAGWARFAALASAPVTVTVRGVVEGIDVAERVAFAPADYWRVEDGSGRLRYLANDVGHFQYRATGGDVACFEPRRLGYWSSGGMESPALIKPRNLVDPEDDDFTRPVSAVDDVVYLGRPALRVVLAPPPRKPAPLVQIVDVATGLVLAMEATSGQRILAFTAVATDIELPAATFREP